jgi:hypothetical protein
MVASSSSIDETEELELLSNFLMLNEPKHPQSWTGTYYNMNKEI